MLNIFDVKYAFQLKRMCFLVSWLIFKLSDFQDFFLKMQKNSNGLKKLPTPVKTSLVGGNYSYTVILFGVKKDITCYMGQVGYPPRYPTRPPLWDTLPPGYLTLSWIPHPLLVTSGFDHWRTVQICSFVALSTLFINLLTVLLFQHYFRSSI